MANKFKNYLNKNREALNSKSAKIGGYSFFLTIVVLAIIIAVNVLVSALPTKYTQFDISAQQLYSLTSSTKVVVTNLEKDVDIYWICQAGKEDAVLEKLLSVYDGLSEHLTVTRKDPDVFPTFAEKYTDAKVTNNSLVIECGNKSRYISYSDIYEQDASEYYTTGSVSTYFDGEGEITTAIDYAVSDDLPKVYVLSGHGEEALSESLETALQKQNIEVEKDFTLLNVDAVPEDADCVMLYAPQNDLSEEEVAMLKDYMNQGGHLFVMSGPNKEGTLTNLHTLLSDYDISVADGIVVEADRSHYAFNEPYILLADIQSSEMTDALIDAGSYVIVSIAEGLNVGTNSNGATVTPLLTTSDLAFSKIKGYDLDTYEKEEEDTDGPFTLALSVENKNEGKMIWISSNVFLEDTYNAYSAGANMDFAMNSLLWMVGETDSISIRSKSLDYSFLTISDSTAGRIKICLIGIIPLAYLLFGLDEVLRRRKCK